MQSYFHNFSTFSSLQIITQLLLAGTTVQSMLSLLQLRNLLPRWPGGNPLPPLAHIRARCDELTISRHPEQGCVGEVRKVSQCELVSSKVFLVSQVLLIYVQDPRELCQTQGEDRTQRKAKGKSGRPGNCHHKRPTICLRQNSPLSSAPQLSQCQWFCQTWV